jgi:multicomponent K+:H+ antiporter subunit A
MSDPLLLTALLIPLAGAVFAAAAGLPAVNRRLTVHKLAWLLALAPLAAFGLLLWQVVVLGRGPAQVWRFDWIPSLGIGASLYLDHLSGLFGLLVTGIGVLIVVYSGTYFRSERRSWDEWRFLAYLLLFMTAMLGLVLAGDVITLFIFWEGTSILSFLLVAYRTNEEAARKGAFKSLFITGGGGIALLIGFLLLGSVAGSTDLAVVLGSGDLLRRSALYPTMLCLIAVGAFTKSAQTPFHIWLPDAMTAPTPASAYLHSATMVKAGIYLLARLNPALGFTDLWFWLLSLTGITTMLAGAYLGLKQNDLKALLAYSTISQLGVLVVLIGQDTEIAFKALVIGVVAHALYKSALFLLAGIVDHETGSRDLRRLGGLVQRMPISFLIGAVAALSMAGLPPLFGFLAKETLLATATHPNVPPIVDFVFPAATVFAGTFVLAQAGMLLWDTFLGRPRDATIHAHEAPWIMLLAPAIPALLSLAVGVLPEPGFVARFLADAAAEVYGAEVKVSLAIWTGISVPLLLSIVAVSLGTGLFLARHRVRTLQMSIGEKWSLNTLYAGVLELVDQGAALATKLQNGKLRSYLVVMLLGVVALAGGFGGLSRWESLSALSLPTLDFAGELALLRIYALLVTVTAAAATVFVRRDISAIIALGASGLAIAVLMVLEPAPDVALVQIVVDILTVVVLVLTLTRLSRKQRSGIGMRSRNSVSDTQRTGFLKNRAGLLRDAAISVVSGAVVAYVTLVALTSRPRESVVSPYYEASAKILTGAKDVVGAIIVDFRALDTLLEIVVFSLAGLGVYTLLRYASKQAGDRLESLPIPSTQLPTLGIAGRDTSAFVHALAYVSLPLSMVVAVVHMMYGHDQPGDGFTAGVIISLALGFWYVVFGYDDVRQRLTWLRPGLLVGGGLLLVIASAITAALLTGSFLGHFDFGKRWGLPLPSGFYLSTSFLFEVAICLVVLGSATYLLDTLGHPGEEVS